MSEVKAPKKVATESKKPEAKKPEIKKTEADQSTTAAETTPADKSADKSVDKSDASPKSASQSSISHFSSVSTPEYRSGWNSIFGGGEATKRAKSKKISAGGIPVHFTIADDDIDTELRTLLHKALLKQARNQGVNLAKIKKSAVIEYSLDCKIKEK